MNPIEIITNWFKNAKTGWLATLAGILIILANYGGDIHIGGGTLTLPPLVVEITNYALTIFAAAVLIIGNPQSSGLIDYLKTKFAPPAKPLGS